MDKYKFAIVFFGLMSFLIGDFSYAQEKNQTEKKPQGPIENTKEKELNSDENQPLHIVSDKLIAQKEFETIEFLGNVKANQKDSNISADSIKFFFVGDKKQDETKKQTKNSNNKTIKDKIDKIIAQGNVKYKLQDKNALAEKAVYTALDEKLVLTGKKVIVTSGSNIITGQKIIFYNKTGKIIAESNEQVEATFNPDEKISIKKQ